MGAISATSLAVAFAFTLAVALASAAPMLGTHDYAPKPTRPRPESFAWFVSSAVRTHVGDAKLIILDVADNFADAPVRSKMHRLRECSWFRPQALAAFREGAAAVVPGFEMPALPGGSACGALSPAWAPDDEAVRDWLVSLADALDVGLQIYLSENPPDSRASWAAWAHRIELLNWALGLVAFDAEDFGGALAAMTQEDWERPCATHSLADDGDWLLNDNGLPAVLSWLGTVSDLMLGTSQGDLFNQPVSALQLAEFAHVDPFERRGAALARILRGGNRFDRCYQLAYGDDHSVGHFADVFQLRHLLKEFFYYHDEVSKRYQECEYV